ncbi:SusC/RagA family TonB-linked outer membrane protein [Chitinophaga ginsengisegetis]|uniref:SusC/RagA family TonB-linked outer membrane protein n=1 Tax=Chitinophaga ginsengisegetis TaxID=393003 RepID=UPI000DB97D07|nr:TonB-dependent receptor [Chitinophaga ginsengisegetis]MDR6565150.1 TonB-linked SusC/RagA family outer membrane protein [Chitinophaga ginsengisegetis]MDR6644877.1 TonB-linked SusC/RagA family outer membrane protein [Chitinophaga ginsengisegetis]MDR6652531.1 TonB-linked SusC/RagA family outer membrane protein [Chitinophaga ginsengisegetis]
MKKRFLGIFILLVLSTIFHLTTKAQNKIIKGTVTDDKNAPVIMASVGVKGTATGTTTNETGAFTLSVPPGSDSIMVSAIGYASKVVAITGNVLNIQLRESLTGLDEVVVVGYGTQKKADLTAPISVVNTDDMLKRTTATPMEALQGSVPGVQVVTSGVPGSSPNVRIRGVGSFNNENPLYVVDGMFVSDISFLNPNDIADMSVLKDASAAAIYGVRAANGVVLITTKKGKLNMKTRVTYNAYVGVQKPTNVLKMANGQQYTDFSLKRGSTADSGTVLLSSQKFGGSGLNPTTSTDWYDVILRKSALITNHGIDIQGGSDKITYSVGLNYTYQNGILNALNNFKRYNGRLQLEARAFPWLKVGFSAIFNNSITFTPNSGAFLDAYTASPLFPVYDSTNVNAFPVKFTAASVIGRSDDKNPMASAYYNYNRSKAFQILPTLYAEAGFWDNKLTFRSQLSQIYGSLLGTQYSPLRNLGPGADATVSHLTSIQERTTNYILDNLLTYKDGKGRHHWSLLLGQSTREERWRQTRTEADNVPDVEESWYTSQGTPNAAYYKEDGTRNAGISFFTRGTYDFDNKYLLTATFRADGSSKYQTKWGYFPSVGLGWVISKEAFMRNQKVFDFLKLRGSWGQLGNDGVNANAGYAIVKTGNSTSAVFGSTAAANGQYLPGYTVNRFYTDITWEVVTEWDGGVDFEMLKGKLNGSVDYYNRKTTKAALYRPFPFTYTTIYGNWADMVNSGWDIALNWHDKIGNVGYQIGANMSTLKNKVTNLGTLPSSTSGFPEWTAEFPNRIVVGQPINYFYGYEFIGVYQTKAEVDGDPVAAHYNQSATSQIVPGFPKYKDQNGDGILDDKDRINMGSYLPKVTYGFNFGLTYKNFDFSVAFQGVSGNKIMNLNRGRLYKASTSLNLDEKFASNLWTGPGSTNAYPSAYALGQGWFKVSNSFFVESGAYLRVQNIQLGYNFNVGKQSPIALRVFGTADRPFIFTKYNGFTPEVGTNTSFGYSVSGYDANVYPVSSTYSLGVRATF